MKQSKHNNLFFWGLVSHKNLNDTQISTRLHFSKFLQ